MQVQPISFSNNIYTYNAEKSNSSVEIQNNKAQLVKDKFSPTFTGFPDVLTKAAQTAMTRESEAEKFFEELLNSLAKESKYKVTENFTWLSKIFKENGIGGIFKTLSNNSQQGNTIAEDLAKNNTISLAKLNNTDLLIIHNTDRQSFWAKFFDLKPQKQSPNITFSDRYNSISFTVKKNGNISISQYSTGSYNTTEFDKTTGHRRKFVKCTGAFEEAVYYHKNGKLDKLKTMLWGFPMPVRP